MPDKLRVFVGTYTEPIRFGTGQILEGKGEGIYLFELDPEEVKIRLVWKKTGVRNPSFLELSPSRRFLYAVNELKDFEGRPSGAVSAFRLEEGGTPPGLLNRRPSMGTDPCHVAVHPAGSHLFVTNYMSGSVCVHPLLEDGSLGEMSDFVQHEGSSVNQARQRGPHAHSAVFDRSGSRVFVSDLGADELVIYEWEAEKGKLRRDSGACFKARPGAGPRHLVLHPRSPFAYLVNELDSTISALEHDESRLSFKELQVIGTLPPGFSGASSCADLHIAPAGNFLYASNRGHDSLAVFRIEEATGRLEPAGHFHSGGRTPRSFDIDPTGSFLLAGNQDTDNIVLFRLDPRSGALEATGLEIEVPTPVCVRIYESGVPD